VVLLVSDCLDRSNEFYSLLHGPIVPSLNQSNNRGEKKEELLTGATAS